MQADFWRGPRSAGSPSLYELRHHVPTTSGRTALFLLWKTLGIRPGEQVLVPAYHCQSMIEPVLRAEARARCYRVTMALEPDLDHLLAQVGRATRAVLAVHYFGFVQDFSELRRLCDDRGLVLVEDCAHALYGQRNGHAVGTMGHYAVSSERKIFPSYDGGGIHSPAPIAAIVNKSDLSYEARAAKWCLDAIRTRILQPNPAAATPETASEPPVSHYRDPRFEPSSDYVVKASVTSRVTRWLAAEGRLIARRRAHYEALQEVLAAGSGFRQLFDVLPEGVAPYVMPVDVDDGGQAHARLKALGVPMYRWEKLHENGVCPVSSYYRLSLIQLPCHQSLTGEDLRWLTGTLAELTRSAFPGDPR